MNDAQKAFVMQIMTDFKVKERKLIAEREQAEELTKQINLELAALKQKLDLYERVGKKNYKIRLNIDAAKLVFYTGATRTKEFRRIIDSSGEQNLILNITFENLIPKPLDKPFKINAVYYFACSIYGNKKLLQGETFSAMTVVPTINQLFNYLWVNLVPNVCSLGNLKLCQGFSVTKCVTGEQTDFLEIIISEL
jgi:hypothetical protein